MYPYDEATYDPPAPTIEMSISLAGVDVPSAKVTMLLDSGADMTCLPEVVAREWKIKEYGAVSVENFLGQSKILRTIYVDLEFGGRVLQDIEVLPISQPQGFLGRDVINSLPLRLDGPSLAWSILEVE